MARLTLEELEQRGGAGRRLALLLDGAPWLELGPAAVSALGLANGDEIDETRRGAIEAQLGARARSLALRSLAARGRSVAELRSRLAAADIPEAVAEEAIDTVTGYGYLDDESLAEEIVRSLRERGYGPRRAEQALRSRGIDREHAAAALERGFGTEDETALARAAIARKRLGRDERAAARAAAQLERRGFSSEAAWQAVRDVLHEQPGEP